MWVGHSYLLSEPSHSVSRSAGATLLSPLRNRCTFLVPRIGSPILKTNQPRALEKQRTKLTLAIGKMCLAAALAMTPAYAAVVVNDKTIIDLTVFVPCAANGAGEIVAL